MSTSHKQVNLSEITFMVPPDRKTAVLKTALAKEREVARTGDHITKHQAQLNVEQLEAWIESSERNDAARLAREAEFKATRQAEAQREEERRQAASDVLDAKLKTTFLAQPGATEADWLCNRDRLRDEHLTRQADEALARTRRAFRI
jgi:hypothetical protein